MLVVMIVSLIAVRFVLGALGEVEYGFYTSVGGVVLMLSFLSGTLTTAAQRFFAYGLAQSDATELNKTFNSVFLVFTLIVVIVLFIAESVGVWFVHTKMVIPPGREWAADLIYQLSVISFIITILSTPYISVIIARENMRLYAIVGIIEAILQLGTALSLFIFQNDKTIIYCILMLLTNLISKLIYVFYCQKSYPEAKLNVKKIEKASVRSIVSFSSWSIFGSISGVATNHGSNLVLNLFHGPIANAAFSVAHQLSSAMQVLSTNMMKAVCPQLVKSYASGDYPYMMRLFYMSNKLSFLLNYFLILPMLICTEQILNLWIGSVSEYMVIFSKLAMVFALVFSLHLPITTIIQAANNVKIYHGVVDTFTLLCLPLSYFLLKNGFAASTIYYVLIAVFSLAFIIRILILKKTIIFSIKQYFLKFILPTIFFVLLTVSLSFTINAIPTTSLFMRLLIVFVLCTVANGIVAYLIYLDKNEKDYFHNMFRNLRIFNS